MVKGYLNLTDMFSISWGIFTRGGYWIPNETPEVQEDNAGYRDSKENSQPEKGLPKKLVDADSQASH